MGSKHIEKKCSGCRHVKLVDEFYKVRLGRDAYCKSCRRDKDRARGPLSRANQVKRLKEDPLFYRRKKLLKLYGITHEQWLEMYEAQEGVCAICGEPEKRVLYGTVAHLVVDHDHRTGKVRALLCHHCNVALGRYEDLIGLKRCLTFLIEKGSIARRDIVSVLEQILGDT